MSPGGYQYVVRQTPQFAILPPPFSSSIIFYALFKLSVPYFSHPRNGYYKYLPCKD